MSMVKESESHFNAQAEADENRLNRRESFSCKHLADREREQTTRKFNQLHTFCGFETMHFRQNDSKISLLWEQKQTNKQTIHPFIHLSIQWIWKRHHHSQSGIQINLTLISFFFLLEWNEITYSSLICSLPTIWRFYFFFLRSNLVAIFRWHEKCARSRFAMSIAYRCNALKSIYGA